MSDITIGFDQTEEELLTTGKVNRVTELCPSSD
jgi:hypothetical protein